MQIASHSLRELGASSVSSHSLDWDDLAFVVDGSRTIEVFKFDRVQLVSKNSRTCYLLDLRTFLIFLTSSSLLPLTLKAEAR